jgi:peptidoglycan/LPS O-acetylase OafA/YrhL
MLVTFLVMTFWDFLGDGPHWSKNSEYVSGACNDRWWANLLFIGEWLGGRKCLAWIWYIDNDMVFFAFLPLLLWLYIKKRKIAYITFISLIASNMIYVFAITEIKGLGGFMVNEKEDYDKYIYRRPWGRYGVYVLGVMLGCMYFEYRNQEKHENLSTTFGTKFFNLIQHVAYVRHILFIVGFIFINLIIFGPIKELQGF